MNLNLIRKYEKEFLHMLHGGTLLSRVMFYDEDDEMYTIWYKVNSCNNMKKWSSDYLFTLSDIECEYLKPQFIINDEYLPYRKALAEGKTVQYMNSNGEIKSLDDWDNIGWKQFKGCVENYRIKPDEPEFKVGDWITVNGPTGTFTECISGIADDTYTLSGTNICYKSQASKWEPKEGEICIFWDDNWVTKTIIIKFNYINNSNQYTAIDNTCWDNCMPFTGTVPPHIKDNK